MQQNKDKKKVNPEKLFLCLENFESFILPMSNLFRVCDCNEKLGIKSSSWETVLYPLLFWECWIIYLILSKVFRFRLLFDMRNGNDIWQSVVDLELILLLRIWILKYLSLADTQIQDTRTATASQRHNAHWASRCFCAYKVALCAVKISQGVLFFLGEVQNWV